MKKLITFLILFSPVLLLGQTRDTTKSFVKPNFRNELGIKIISITDISGVFGVSVNLNYLNGIIYKYKISEKYALRNSIEWQFEKYRRLDIETYGDSGITKNIVTKTGIEWRIGKHKLVPYFAIDFSYRYNQDRGIGHYPTGCFCPEVIVVYDRKKNELGIEPTIGLSYSPIKKLTISIETSLLLYRSWASYFNYGVMLHSTNSEPYSNTSKYHDNYMVYQPLRILSLTYNFGNSHSLNY